MNMLDKIDRLAHDDMGCGAGYGSVCTCGLDEVRAAVRELVQASKEVVFASIINPPRPSHIRRQLAALKPFLDAQD